MSIFKEPISNKKIISVTEMKICLCDVNILFTTILLEQIFNHNFIEKETEESKG